MTTFFDSAPTIEPSDARAATQTLCDARSKAVEDRAARLAYAAGLGASEWEAFVGIAEDVLIAEGVIYWWRYSARRAPGTGTPSVWIASTGPETSRISDHRTMLGARFKAWRLNRCHGWREAIRQEGVAANAV